MRNIFRGFRDFIARGNAVDLAVGVVIGSAFSAVVSAVVDGFINPLIAAIFGEPDLSGVGNFTINNANFSLGLVLNALFTFVCVALALYIVIVLPMNKLTNLRKPSEEAPEPEARDEAALLREIRDLLADQRRE